MIWDLIVYLWTKVLHCTFGSVVIFEVLCGTCGGVILILRQRNLSKQCLLRFLCLKIRMFTVCAVKRFNECHTKLDNEELWSLSISVP